MADIDVLKEQFLMVFSNDGHYQWTVDYKKQYIYALKQLQDDDVKELTENIIAKKPSEVYEIVQKYDKDLTLFALFNKNYELYSKKTIELYSLNFTAEDEKNLKKLESKEYSFNLSEEWENIGIINEDNKISYIFAQSSYETSSTKIESLSFDSKTWDNIRAVAAEKAKLLNGNLLYINAKVVSPKRKILKITFDLTEKLFSVSYDNNEVDENGKKIDTPSINRSVLQKTIIPQLPLSKKTQNKVLTSLIQSTNKIVTQATLDKISFFADEEILVIPTIQKINLENTQTTEHSERITSEMYNQKGSEIEKVAKKEFDQYGTLKDFFTHNKQHDTRNNQIKLIETREKNTERIGFHAYIIVVRNAKDIEKPISSKNYNNGKVIDLLSVDFDYGNNEMNIRNANCSGESQNAIIHKILELSK